jgi:hypothetical protein
MEYLGYIVDRGNNRAKFDIYVFITSIILPVVSASALTWFIKYNICENLQLLNHVNIIQTKVLLSQIR